jgi:hypothetical protein
MPDSAAKPATGLAQQLRIDSMNLKSMSIDKLSKLKEQVAVALNTKVIEERRAVQDQLSKFRSPSCG